ncbi:MAG: site-specific DNA-methyltransferase [Sulfuricaulis sp.]|nr:site-specific DNA-methyltransferase [Sulfuricaulis sp.]
MRVEQVGGVTIVQGDAIKSLRLLDDQSVNCCVTSPPYWGLRDYGVTGQLGLESTPQEYVEKMVQVFREVRRVLRDDGTVFLNLGDSYSGSGKGGNPPESKHQKQATNHGSCFAVGETARSEAVTNVSRRWTTELGIAPKNLIGIPWRVAFALQADGWYLRQDIIWAKPNPMPESVRDRCTKSHEYIFLLAKSEKYYYDFESMQEPMVTNDNRKPYAPGQVDARGNGHDRGGGQQRKPKGNAKTFRGGGAYTQGQSFDNSADVERQSHGNTPNEKGTRNRRSVWTVSTKPYKEAHFATFPPDLIEPCILAGCPEGGVVLDPFGGSGTTGLVAQRHGRQAVLLELNPAYIDLTVNRIKAG